MASHSLAAAAPSHPDRTRELIQRWKEDPGATYRSWFL